MHSLDQVYHFIYHAVDKKKLYFFLFPDRNDSKPLDRPRGKKLQCRKNSFLVDARWPLSVVSGVSELYNRRLILPMQIDVHCCLRISCRCVTVFSLSLFPSDSFSVNQIQCQQCGNVGNYVFPFLKDGPIYSVAA